MNPPTEQDKQHAAQLREAADIIDQGLPWQFLMDGEWHISANPTGQNLLHNIAGGWKIRRAPWTLKRTCNGHTLAEGQEWHRLDWKREWLPDTCRPLIKGEFFTKGDELASTPGHWTKSCCEDEFKTNGIDDRGYFCRTTRPLPPIPDPYAEEKAAFARGETIQFRPKSGQFPWCIDRFPEWLPGIDYRIKPQPALISLDAGDITTAHEFSPDCTGAYRYQWGIIANSRISLGGGTSALQYTFEILKANGWHYRAGTDEWKPCSKSAP